MSKKTNAKPDAKHDKKPAKGDAKKPGKGKGKGDTSPAEKKGKGRRAEPEAAAPPAPPPAPPEAPAPPPASTASVLDDDPSRWIDGKALHEKGKYLLNVCPKAKENPAEACVAVRGQVAAATDERSCFWVDLGCVVCESPLKVTRASFDAFMALLDGELKAAEKLEASVVVRWDGLVATIRREGEDEGRVVLLDRFESGPDAEHFFLDAPEFAEGSHAMMSIERLRVAATWKGEGTAHLFVSPSARQVWIQFDAGGFTFARAVVAFDGSNLGVRQPSLPMDASGKKAAPPPPAKPEPQVIEPEVVPPPGAPRGLPAGLAWARVECDRGAAWERLTRQATEMLAPFSVEAGPGGEGGLVVWGPYPRDSHRLRFVFNYLKSQGLDPRVVPCEAVNLWTRALAEAASAPALGLDAGPFVAGELPAGELGPGGGDAPAFPDPPAGVPVVVEIPLSIYDDAFTEDETDDLHLLDRERNVDWRIEGEAAVSRSLDAEEARAVAALLAGWGYRAAGVEDAERGGARVQVWTVGRAGESGATS